MKIQLFPTLKEENSKSGKIPRWQVNRVLLFALHAIRDKDWDNVRTIIPMVNSLIGSYCTKKQEEDLNVFLGEVARYEEKRDWGRVVDALADLIDYLYKIATPK